MQCCSMFNTVTYDTGDETKPDGPAACKRPPPPQMRSVDISLCHLTMTNPERQQGIARLKETDHAPFFYVTTEKTVGKMLAPRLLCPLQLRACQKSATRLRSVSVLRGFDCIYRPSVSVSASTTAHNAVQLIIGCKETRLHQIFILSTLFPKQLHFPFY